MSKQDEGPVICLDATGDRAGPIGERESPSRSFILLFAQLLLPPSTFLFLSYAKENQELKDSSESIKFMRSS